MLGVKRFDNAAVTIGGIELAEKVKKGQCRTGRLGGRRATMAELWNAALAALKRAGGWPAIMGGSLPAYARGTVFPQKT